MKELYHIVMSLVMLILSFVLMGTSFVSVIKGDPAHVWVAYGAGAVALIVASGWERERS